MGQERLRHVVMPALPGPHFVVIHAHLALRPVPHKSRAPQVRPGAGSARSVGFLEGRFDRPSHPANPHQFPLGYPLGRVRQEHPHGPLLETASENRRRLGTGPAALFRTGHAHQRKLSLDRALRAFLDRVAPPRALGQLRGDRPNPRRGGVPATTRADWRGLPIGPWPAGSTSTPPTQTCVDTGTSTKYHFSSAAIPSRNFGSAP
jgi:hypothetical protein